MLLTLFCFSPYGYSLTALDVVVLLVGGLLPLALAGLALQWGFKRLQLPSVRHKQQAQPVLSGVSLATAGYFYWFLNWLLG